MRSRRNPSRTGRSPRLAEPPQQGLLGRFDENQRRGFFPAQVLQDGWQFLELLSLAGVDQ